MLIVKISESSLNMNNACGLDKFIENIFQSIKMRIKNKIKRLKKYDAWFSRLAMNEIF